MNKTAIRTDFTVLQSITRDFTTCIKDLSTCLWIDRAGRVKSKPLGIVDLSCSLFFFLISCFQARLQQDAE